MTEPMKQLNLTFNKAQWQSEASVTTVFMDWLENIKDSRWYKIPDIWNKTKPLDIVWNLWWRFVAIEVKHIKNKTKPADPYREIANLLELHQIVNLEINTRAWWLSYIAGYFVSLNQLLIFPWIKTS